MVHIIEAVLERRMDEYAGFLFLHLFLWRNPTEIIGSAFAMPIVRRIFAQDICLRDLNHTPFVFMGENLFKP
jgi:hypothetical protein